MRDYQSEFERNKKHIAFYISALRKGGAERVMANLVNWFAKEGYKVTLVTQYAMENEYEIATVSRVFSDLTNEEETTSRIKNFFRRYKKLQDIWKETNPDVVLSFIGLNNIMALLTTRRLHIPVVVAVRGDPKEEYAGRKLQFLQKATFKKAAGLVLQTKDSALFFEKKARKKAVVLKNPLSEGLLAIQPFQEIREKRIVTAGRLDANKNQEMLIRAFAKVIKKYPEYSLSIYGDGEDMEKLITLVSELGIQSHVEFTGSVSDVWEREKKAEIFVLSSYTEGMPNALLEAMALGLACVSTDCPCGGPRDVIEDGENGLLIPVGDEGALEKALLRLMEDGELKNKLGSNACKIRETHSPSVVLKEWENVLCEAMRG